MLSKFLFLAGLLYMPVVYADLQGKQHTGVAGIDFESQVGYDVGYNDNVTLQHKESNAIAAGYQQLTPLLKMIGQRYEDHYLLMYSGDYRRYNGDSADDRSNHFLMFKGDWRFGQKQGFSLDLDETLGHEERGKDTTEGFLPEQYQQFGINQPIATRFLNSEARYHYGAPEGRGKFELALQYKQLRFRNLQGIQNADDDFYRYMLDQEWHENSLVAEIFDQKSKNLRYRYSFITNQRRYELNPQKDSNEYYLVVGMKNKLSGKSEIDANVAWLYKGFINNPDAQLFSGLNWNINATWKPVKQSTLKLHSSQLIKDPTDAGGYVRVTNNGLAWEHHWWVDRLSTIIDYSYITENYKNQSSGRKDRKNLLSLTFNYDFRPSINFKLKLQKNTLHSNKEKDAFFIGPNADREVDRTLGYDDSAIIFMTQVQI
ncbi:outer membrane beta-barrel protein [Enterobacter ludwigii]|jgi:hypothetical protein